jgi:uncharacterized protein
MTKDCNYITLDGRNDSGEFLQTVLDAFDKLKEDEGMHIIKEFEPFPLFALMESKGMDSNEKSSA